MPVNSIMPATMEPSFRTFDSGAVRQAQFNSTPQSAFSNTTASTRTLDATLGILEALSALIQALVPASQTAAPSFQQTSAPVASPQTPAFNDFFSTPVMPPGLDLDAPNVTLAQGFTPQSPQEQLSQLQPFFQATVTVGPSQVQQLTQTLGGLTSAFAPTGALSPQGFVQPQPQPQMLPAFSAGAGGQVLSFPPQATTVPTTTTAFSTTSQNGFSATQAPLDQLNGLNQFFMPSITVGPSPVQQLTSNLGDLVNFGQQFTQPSTVPGQLPIMSSNNPAVSFPSVGTQVINAPNQGFPFNGQLPPEVAGFPSVGAPAGFTQGGFGQFNQMAPSFPQQNFVQPNFVQPGFTQSSFVQPSFVQPGFSQPGFSQGGFPSAAFPSRQQTVIFA